MTDILSVLNLIWFSAVLLTLCRKRSTHASTERVWLSMRRKASESRKRAQRQQHCSCCLMKGSCHEPQAQTSRDGAPYSHWFTCSLLFHYTSPVKVHHSTGRWPMHESDQPPFIEIKLILRVRTFSLPVSKGALRLFG